MPRFAVRPTISPRPLTDVVITDHVGREIAFDDSIEGGRTYLETALFGEQTLDYLLRSATLEQEESPTPGVTAGNFGARTGRADRRTMNV